MADQANPKPPELPEIERTLHFHRLQMIGIPLIMLIPILALFGLFDPAAHSEQTRNGSVELDVEYTSRMHYKVAGPVIVRVKNISATTVPTLTVAFDAEYISSFEQVSFKPDVDSISDAVYTIEINDVEPNSLRIVEIELETAHAGTHTGTISVAAGAEAPIEVEIHQLVLP